MKLFLFLIFLYLTYSQAPLDGYQLVEKSEVDSSPEIQTLAEFGLETILQQAIEQDQISNDDFEISQIFTVYRQEQGKEVKYKFDCEFSNQKRTTIKANFEVSYNTDTSEMKMISSSYNVQRLTALDLIKQSFTEVGSSEAQYNAEIQDVLKFGVNEVIKQGISEKNIPVSSDYSISKITSVFRQIISNALFYKCQVDIKSNKGVTITSTFTVYYQPTTGTRLLADYSYQVKTVQPMTNTKVPQPSFNNFISIAPEEAQDDEQISKVLQAGVDALAQAGVQEGKIPNSKYRATNVKSASWEMTAAGEYYQFSCDLQSENVVGLQADFMLFHETKTDKTSLISYSYQVTNSQKSTISTVIGAIDTAYTPIEASDVKYDEILKSVLDYGTRQILRLGVLDGKIVNSDFTLQDVTEVYSQIVGNGVFYKFVCTLVNKQEITVQTSFTVYFRSDTKQKKLTTYSYNILISQDTVFTSVVRPVKDEYTEIDVSTVQQDKTITNVLQFGVQAVLQFGTKANQLPSADFGITKIDEVETQTVRYGMFYKFTCELSSGQNANLLSTFVVFSDTSGSNMILSSYSYQLTLLTTTTYNEVVEPVDGAYVQLDVVQTVQDKTIQGLLQFGVQQVVNKGIQEKKVPASTYQVVTIFGIYKQEVKQGQFYRFEVELANEQSTSIRATFVVYFRADTQEKTFAEYSYNVETSQTSQNVENTSTANVKPDESAYQAIQVSKVQQDAKIQAVVAFGITEVIKKASQDKKITDSDFGLTNIVQAFSQKVSTGTFYKFQVELRDSKGVTMTTTFTVFEDTKTSKRTLYTYSYTISTTTTTTTVAGYVEGAFTPVDITEIQHNAEIQNCLKYGVEQIVKNAKDFTITNINSVSRQVVEGALYYKFDINLSDNKNTTIQATFTTYYQPVSKQISIEAYSYRSLTKTTITQTTITTTTIEATSSTTRRFSVLTAAEVQKDSTTQGLLQYGLQECLKSLVTNKVITDANVKVSQVVSVLKQVIDGMESYRFELVLTSSTGSSLQAEFEVNYDTDTQTKMLAGYSVEGSSPDQTGDVVLANYDDEKNQQLVIGNYEKVAASEVKSSSDIQAAVQYGIIQTLQMAVKTEKFSSTDFQLEQINNVYREVVNRQSYNVDATLVNSKGEKIDANFGVDYSLQAGLKRVTQASYIVYQ